MWGKLSPMNPDPTRTSPPEADATRTQGEPTTRTGELRNDEPTVVPHTPIAGGMGVVYPARHAVLNRPVALKVVKGGIKVGGKAVIRFLA